MQKQLTYKVLTIFIVGLLLLIPINMVKYKVYDRQAYLEEAKTSVAQSWTGRQTFISPVLVIPYSIKVPIQSVETESVSNPDFHKKTTAEFVQAKALDVSIQLANSSVFKGIYEVPVYNSNMTFSGFFSADTIQKHISRLKNLENFDSLGEPYISLYISDIRGIDQIPILSINNEALPLETGSHLNNITTGLYSAISEYHILQKDMNFVVTLSLRGMEGLSFISMSDNATTTMTSGWQHPQFIGASLPKTREISAEGFVATWSASRYSSSGVDLMTDCVERQQCSPLFDSASGVNFIEPVDVYLQTERSIKYAILFIGLSFISFFIFEHLKRQAIHPIQYAFVGLAIAVFYLLLISLAEHIAFYWAYAVAAISCASLFYVRYVLQSFVSGALYCAMISFLYGLLYVIVQAEDFALLMGSILVFLVLAVLMVITKDIDWYSLSDTSTLENNANI